MDDMQKPGQLIVPHGPDSPEQPDGAPKSERPVEPVENPTPVPAPESQSQSLAGLPTNQSEVVSQWQYRQEASGTTAPQPQLDDISWTASEFIAHDKSFGWYALLVVVALAICALIYFLTKDKISTAITVLVMIFFGVYAARKPRTLQYSLTDYGLHIGDKTYSFHDFKTFSIAEEGAIVSIVFMPLKRFMPPLTIYVAPEMEERVVDSLSVFLPFEAHRSDVIDSFLRRIRF